MVPDTAPPSWIEVIIEEDGSAHMSARSRRIEVFTGPERRRWFIEQKWAIVVESYRDGASPTAVARRYDLNTGQLYTWRRRLTVRSAPAFARIEPARENPRHQATGRPRGVIEIVLPGAAVVRIDACTREGGVIPNPGNFRRRLFRRNQALLATLAGVGSLPACS